MGSADLTKPRRRPSERPPKLDSLGRPNPGCGPLDLDAARIEELARSRRSIEDIALLMGCSADTLDRRYRDAIRRGRAWYRQWLHGRAVAIVESGDIKAAKDMVIHLDLREYGPIPKDEVPVQRHEHLHVLLERSAEEIQRALAAAEMREQRAIGVGDARTAVESGTRSEATPCDSEEVL